MRALPRWLLVLAASAFVTLVCYGRVLSYGLTDMDALMDVAEGRVESVSDALSLAGEKLTGGRARVGANFYRPAMMLVFAGLRGVFGWEPAGYHAFDLALHALNAWLLALFATAAARRVRAPRPFAFGVTCGAITAVHPIGVEVVPAVARNGDLLVTIWILLGLLAVLGWDPEAPARHRGRLAAFALSFALAVATKEPGVVLLGAAWLAVVFLRDRPPLRRRALRAAWLAVPCVPILAVYFAARVRVLGDLLGGYQTGLGPWFMARFVANQLFVDLFLPGYAHAIDDYVPALHSLEGPVPLLLLSLPLLAAAAVLSRPGPRRRAAAALASPLGRLAGFAVAVLGVQAALFAATGVYERRLLYPAAAMASFLPAAAGVAAFEQLPRRRAPAVAVAALALVLAPQLPLFHRYDEWRSSGETTRLLTEGLRAEWEALPSGARVLVLNMPSGFAFDPMRRVMYAPVSSTNAPPPKALKAWLDDQFPDQGIAVGALGLYRYRAPVDAFAHRAQVRGGWLAFDTPPAREDGADDPARESFRFVQLSPSRVAVSARGRIPRDVFLLVFDGRRPRMLPARRLTGGPIPPALRASAKGSRS